MSDTDHAISGSREVQAGQMPGSSMQATTSEAKFINSFWHNGHKIYLVSTVFLASAGSTETSDHILGFFARKVHILFCLLHSSHLWLINDP